MSYELSLRASTSAQLATGAGAEDERLSLKTHFLSGL
jgi:hypothetical protein